MPKLLALAAEDAYAFVAQNNEFFLIRPPFTSGTKKRVTNAALEAAITHHGFARANRAFDSWAGLVEYLRGEFLRARKGLTTELPDPETVRRLVERAPEEVVLRYFGRIEAALVPGEEWSVAIDLLTHLLRNPFVRSRLDLLDTCVALLERCETQRRDREVFLRECGDTTTQDAPLPSEPSWPVELGRRVRDCGQVLLVGSTS